MGWVVLHEMPPPGDPVWRRFGSEHKKPCLRENVLTCAMSECQNADRCQAVERGLISKYDAAVAQQRLGV